MALLLSGYPFKSESKLIGLGEHVTAKADKLMICYYHSALLSAPHLVSLKSTSPKIKSLICYPTPKMMLSSLDSRLISVINLASTDITNQL